MASDPGYLQFILDQLNGVEGVSCRAMMGEYLLYMDGRLVGGLYDDRLLVKDVPAAREKLPAAPHEIPYPGAKPMLLVEDVDDRKALKALFQYLGESLPVPKKRKDAQ
ncbi:MAG: TfoX/Sxy family protein [Oscillospiraceae bacterium]|nr:TfoX/Sxy family protein [Oscillospiraceae bacterium]